MSDILLIQQSENGLSKKQQQFNKLILSVEKRKKTLALLETRFKDYLAGFETVLAQPRKELSQCFLSLAQLFDRHYESGALNRTERRKTIQMVINVCHKIEDPELPEKLLEKYMRLQERGISKQGKKMGQDLFKEMFSAAFGMDIKEEEINFNDLDGLAGRLHEKFAESHEQQRRDNFFRSKHKTYTGLNKKLAEKATLLQKSWKALYLKLVKKLHPDTESDEDKRKHKTGLMQQVTQAYEKNDFYTLLTLYHQEVGFNNAENEQENQLQNDSILDQYINILRQQDKELKDKIGDLQFEAANNYMPYLVDKEADKFFKTALETQRIEMNDYIAEVKGDIRRFTPMADFKKRLNTLDMNDLLFADDVEFGMDDLGLRRDLSIFQYKKREGIFLGA